MNADGRDSLTRKVTPLAWFFLACCAARCVLFWRGFPFGATLDLAMMLWADVLILAVLARRLPPQNWVSLAIFILASGAFVEAHNKSFSYLLVVAWIGILLAARELGRWLLRPSRQNWGYGFWLIGIASILSGSVLTAMRSLIGSPDPLESLLLRTVASVVIFATATVVIISKRPNAEVLEKNTLAIWLGIGLVLGVAAVVRFL